MKYALLIFVSLSFFISHGQSTRVEGTIVADKESLELGQITIFSLPDSTLKKGSYLDSSYFSLPINTGSAKNFYAVVSIPSYLDTTINFSVTDTLTNLGLITPSKDTELETISVMYRKETFKRTMDGVTVNVEGTNLQSLTNLFEVLKASPKITSPDDESIQIIGRGSPLILVDRQAIISNDELKAIPANQIERIEIITNPSAKYKAQGSGNGVIEVYTKDFHLEGYNMTIRSAAGMNTKFNPTVGLNLGLSLKKKKFSLNGYLGGNLESGQGFGINQGTTEDGDRTSSSDFESKNSYLWQYYSIKSAYTISESKRITLGVNGYGSAGMNENTSNSAFAVNGENITESFAFTNSNWTWLNNSAFINYTVETDTNDSNFEINLNYVNKVSSSDGTSRSIFEYLPDEETTRFDVRNNSRDIPNIGELRVNYEHVFDTTGWKLGIGSSYSALFNQKTFDRFNEVDDAWVVDPDFSNSYDYQEHIGAAFLEVSKNWDKVSFRTGIRTEYTRLDGYSNSLEQQFMDSSYILPFPSASIMYQPDPKFAVTLFYDSGIDRPQFSNYDPFVRVQDSLTINYGNPFLRPAIEHSLGLDFDLFYAYNVSLNYNFRKDPISSYSFIDDDSFVTETTPFNALAEQSVGANFSIPIQTKWLQGWNSFWIDYSKYTFTPIFGREPFFNLTYGIYSYLTFTLPKDMNITNRFHVNKWGNAEFENNAQINWGIRFTKKFNGNNFQIFADVGNIVPPKRRQTTYSGNYQFYSSSQSQFTTFKVGVFIKFGRLKAANQIQESTSGQSDRL